MASHASSHVCYSKVHDGGNVPHNVLSQCVKVTHLNVTSLRSSKHMSPLRTLPNNTTMLTPSFKNVCLPSLFTGLISDLVTHVAKDFLTTSH